MFKIYDGREEFFQWDTGRKVIVPDSAITEVHFCNKTDECSLVCAVYELDGVRVADVPNIILTSSWNVNVYGYSDAYTKVYATFKVVPRTKPADYIYTETEVLNYSTLLEMIQNIETGNVDLSNYYTKEETDELLDELEVDVDLSNYYTKAETDELLADVDVDLSGLATEAYVDTAISNIKHPAPDLSDYYTKTEVDTAIDNVEVDLTGYATEKYVDDAVAAIDIPEVGGSVEEVYVGAGTPTDENVKVWIDPDAEPAFATTAYVDEAIAAIDTSGGSGGSTDLSNYYTKTEVDTAISNAIGAVPNAEEGEY